MYSILLVVSFKIIFSEARVFCQDSHALAWKPLGYPCPITCRSIIAAVEKLKIRDYHYLLNGNDIYGTNLSAADIYTIGQQIQHKVLYGRNSKQLHPDTRKHIKLYQTYHRLLSNEYFEEALKIEAGKITDAINKTCSNMASKELYKKIFNVKCTRRLNKRSDLLEKFTKFLNLFSDPKYPFNEEMAGLILEKVQGNRILRYGEVDYQMILAFLREQLNYHRSQSTGPLILRLQSKNCMTLYVPGCSCKFGFVESRGQCVKPERCIKDPTSIEYLDRIIIY